MLKHVVCYLSVEVQQPAAFRRLCVETKLLEQSYIIFVPAAFRRLCVETLLML